MTRLWFVARLGVAAGVMIGPRLAHAQIVNVQGALAKPPDTDKITGRVGTKLEWRTGNNPLFDIGGAGSIVVRRGHLLGLALARGEYGTSGGLTLTKKSFEHVRARIELDDRWRWEVFAQHEYDQFRRLSLRALAGTGPAFQLVHTKVIDVLAGASYLYEYERLDTRPGTTDAGLRTTAHRGSGYVTGHEDIGGGAAIIETVYVQPRLDDPADIRLLGELSLRSKLSSRIALENSFNIAYDRTPPDGIRRTDTQLQVAIAFEL